MTAGPQPAPSDAERGLLDTSVVIARERGRRLGDLPAAAAVSVVTVAELQLGVLMADDPAVRSRRLRTLASVEAHFEPLQIDADVARTFAALVAESRRTGRRPKPMDTRIAATAVAHGLPDSTKDEDFFAIPRVVVVRI